MIFELLGAFVPMAIISLGLGRFAFKDKGPVDRAAWVALTAWIICGTIAGFGMADGGPFYVPAYLYYAPAAAVVGFVLYRHYEKQATAADE